VRRLRSRRRDALCGGGGGAAAAARVEEEAEADGERAKKRCRPGGRVVHAEEEKEDTLVERWAMPKRETPASAAAASGGKRGRSV